MIQRIVSDNVRVSIERYSENQFVLKLEVKNDYGQFDYASLSNLSKDILIELLEVISRMK